MEGYCLNSIVWLIESELQTYNIVLSMVQYTPSMEERIVESAGMEIYVGGDIHGDPIVELRPYIEPTVFQKSPVLFTHIQSTMGFYLFNFPSRDAVAYLAAGIIFYSLEQCDVAQHYFDRAESIGFFNDDGTPSVGSLGIVRFYRGNCALIDGDFETARDYFLLAFPPSYDYPLSEIEVQTNLAWTYIQLDQEDQTFDLMERVVDTTSRIAPFRHIDALTRRAQLYALAFRYDDALADMDAAIELDPTNPELYVLRGQITLYLYEWDRVLADYNRAIELDPDYADAYYYRGILFYTQGYREDALTDFEHYLNLASDGDHAADAAQYVTDIEHELEALG